MLGRIRRGLIQKGVNAAVTLIFAARWDAVGDSMMDWEPLVRSGLARRKAACARGGATSLMHEKSLDLPPVENTVGSTDTFTFST